MRSKGGTTGAEEAGIPSLIPRPWSSEIGEVPGAKMCPSQRLGSQRAAWKTSVDEEAVLARRWRELARRFEFRDT